MQEAESFGFQKSMEREMTKMKLLMAALIAATVFTSEAMAAGHHAAAKRATTLAESSVVQCVRAPDVGAFASDADVVRPCIPNSAY